MEQNEIISSGLLELFVLGLTSEQETAQVIALAKQYPAVEAEIASIEQTLEKYAQAYAVSPSAVSKERILAAISAPNSNQLKAVAPLHPDAAIRPFAFYKYVAAASIILLIGSTILNVNYYRKNEAVNNELSSAKQENSALQQQMLAQQQQTSEMKADMQVIQSKYSEPVSLKGLPDAPDAAAKIFYMKNTGEVYLDPTNLPEAPEGMQYQFWGIVDGKPVDGGMIITTKGQNKYRIQKMKSFGKAEAFAVTLETEGGNPTPKGKMYVMGKM